MRYFFPILLLLIATGLLSAKAKRGSRDISLLPKTFEEKEKIAKGMEKIAKELDVRCEYCHVDAERGLKDGDYTILTEEGMYAHETMFPLSKKFNVSCAFCHTGTSTMTQKGERAHQDIKFIQKIKREKKKNLTCESCHIPGPQGKEFLLLKKSLPY
ncbi:MAG: hypothetical protein LDLANPLL_01751 [Turneriella sp.]|nr:hypothetical protein [Turneriella sp.]